MLININVKILNKALAKNQQHRKRITNHDDQVIFLPVTQAHLRSKITLYIIPPYWQNKEQNPIHISINVENIQQNPGPIYDKLTEN